jgi:hypothetical protein
MEFNKEYLHINLHPVQKEDSASSFSKKSKQTMLQNKRRQYHPVEKEMNREKPI